MAAFSRAGSDEQPAFVLLGLVLVRDEGEAEHLGEPGDRLIIVADDEGDVGKGSEHATVLPKF